MGKIFTRAAALITGVAVAASSVVTAELPAAAAVADCRATFSKYSSIRVGADGSNPKAMECLLGSAGFSNDGRRLWKALQSGRITAPSAEEAPAAQPAKMTKAHQSKGKRALAYARKQLGDGYRYGATGPNRWDCSGLTMKAWKSVGVKLPRASRAQYRVGKKVKRSNLRMGDLVFFYSGISHVGIYAGKGKIIHASRPGHPVAYIKIKYMPYAGARRPH